MAMGAGGGILWQYQTGSYNTQNVPARPLYATSGGGVIFTTSAKDCPPGDISLSDTGGYACSTGLLPGDPNYGQLGTLYTLDQNGNQAVDANGNPIPATPDTGAAYSWTGPWYSSGSAHVSEGIPTVQIGDLAWTWAAVAEGNPSDTRVFAASAGKVEGKPRWWTKLKQALVGSCPKTPGTNKVLLAGAAQQQYLALKTKLISWLQGLQDNSTCKTFFTSDPNRALYFSQLVSALQNQQAYDGIATDIDQYDAGLWTPRVAGLASFSTLKNSPVCTQLSGPYEDSVVAFAQVAPPHTDIYINPKLVKKLTQGTILHETLHNITGLEDFLTLEERKETGAPPEPADLKTFVGIETTPGVNPSHDQTVTEDINSQLEQKGCVNPN